MLSSHTFDSHAISCGEVVVATQPDLQQSMRFRPEIANLSEFRQFTFKSSLVAPIIKSVAVGVKAECVGVVQLLNKIGAFEMPRN